MKHAANYAHTGAALSPTVRGVVTVGAIGLFVWAASRK